MAVSQYFEDAQGDPGEINHDWAVGVRNLGVSPKMNDPLSQGPFTWCLNSGHGALQQGKRSPVWPDGRQLLEYKFNWDIVNRIINLISPYDVDYHIVNPDPEAVGQWLGGDTGRVAQTNYAKTKYPKRYVSIHGNAAGNSDATGIETWYYTTSDEGKVMASIFQRKLMEHVGWKDRGIRARTDGYRSFYELRATWFPAVLTENGFFTNHDECQKMLNPEYREKIAKAHAEAILFIEKNGVIYPGKYYHVSSLVK